MSSASECLFLFLLFPHLRLVLPGEYIAWGLNTKCLCAIKQTEIAKELNMTPVLDKIQEHRRNCVQRTNIMPRNKLPRIIKKTTDQQIEVTRGDR